MLLFIYFIQYTCVLLFTRDDEGVRAVGGAHGGVEGVGQAVHEEGRQVPILVFLDV